MKMDGKSIHYLIEYFSNSDTIYQQTVCTICQIKNADYSVKINMYMYIYIYIYNIVHVHVQNFKPRWYKRLLSAVVIHDTYIYIYIIIIITSHWNICSLVLLLQSCWYFNPVENTGFILKWCVSKSNLCSWHTKTVQSSLRDIRT